MNLSKEQISGLLTALKHTHDEEFNCEQFLDMMAELAESSEAEIMASESLQQLVKHRELCAECREEYEMLAALLDDCADHE